MRAKRASPPQELEFTGPEGPEILVLQTQIIVHSRLFENRFIIPYPIFFLVISFMFLKIRVCRGKANMIEVWEHITSHLTTDRANNRNNRKKVS